jgi:hypothetical protein
MTVVPLKTSLRGIWLAAALTVLSGAAQAVTAEFNNTGGSSATNGLHFYIEDTTHLQVRRLNNTGQVYSPTAIPPSTSLDNGVFIRANGKLYGPSESVAGLTPSGGMYNTYSIGTVSPANPASPGVQQSVTGNFGITNGPQVSVVWSYTTPLDFMTATVTLTIPAGYTISATNPVRYYHVVDNYFGGSDSGCGVSYTDSNGKRVIGSYPPPSGTTCPSQGSIPNGVSVFEFFRERSGLTFSEYCSSYWSDFFQSGGSNCSVTQSTVMSKTVNATYEDTGLGIEFDFTAPGTYTFAYDFVVGSQQVPPYDHLEIQHDGAATLCPDTVTVSACTAATVPCPIANLVNTGTLTGNATTTPATPTVTITPATFTLGATGTTAAVTLQGSGAGTYTLSVANPSSVPLNGTKCWNTATSSQSCTFTVAAASCVSNFECLASSQTYNNLVSSPTLRNPLYTQLAGTAFSFDVVALGAAGSRLTTYAADADKTVTVELVDGAVPTAACASRTQRATTTLKFTKATQATDQGRKSVSFTVPNAYADLRCRVTDANYTPSVVGCSSDDFAIRPTSAILATNLTMATPPSATATPIIKAGTGFILNASIATSGYSGTLALYTSRLTAQAPNQTTLASGGAVGTLLAPGSIDPNAAPAISNNASYSEVGYLYLGAGTYADKSFTGVDRTNGDCITDTTSDNNFSTSLVGGKYGCDIGTLPTTFGRFVPDHFTTAPLAQCGGFAYSGRPGTTVTPGQPFGVMVTANNASGGTTTNYASNFAKAINLTSSPAVGSLYVDSTAGGAGAIPASSFASGVGTVSSSVTTGKISYVFTTFPTAGTTVTLHAEDAETSPSVGIDGSIAIRAGRLRLSNVYGSWIAPGIAQLQMPVEAQYWSGNSWVKNSDDSCTVVATANVLLPAASTWTRIGPGTLGGGAGSISLTPSGAGSISVCADLSTDNGVACSATTAALPWLQSKWPGATTYNNDPSATATFDVFSAEGKRGVYNREMY